MMSRACYTGLCRCELSEMVTGKLLGLELVHTYLRSRSRFRTRVFRKDRKHSQTWKECNSKSSSGHWAMMFGCLLVDG
ncbi:uncharacterized protein K460DRAFT_168335 [Cucurbitaria berberidis CBS 394.84]|uniref:Uncharacterized protein n=1 Tax=Cucurbitaria berberidis CBS 394.84 TaxID=1168544 RepID=A0A9P4L4M9_9PLEO|nr:uncharacterized protein K460DRAFT_168335 [Cucurbitaria berberidis CBS 394.84]KAF1841489.1 hypothetical protein K460DRAFT_168335 [Cucurbitaria berberidis CBS 394.84]